MYKVSGRVKFGLTLSLVTTLLWGLLPIALKDVLAAMDPYTITFYRFLSSGIVLLLWLSVRGGLPVQRQFNAGVLVIILIAAFGLIVNYGAYLIGLELLEPKAAQVLIQLAPFLLLIGGVVFFKEAFSYQQGLGRSLYSLG